MHEEQKDVARVEEAWERDYKKMKGEKRKRDRRPRRKKARVKGDMLRESWKTYVKFMQLRNT
ncbi:hypothetical protein X777_03516 [Ooceraea biroi]|uniref:Uncharacterized protein n=1 Tax=Ooceraea biroi TaxID=2015173 RepID=A0A026WM54_OOCBI|nr:hypothetical protein X777_03516 [Ooceraea biroi]